MNRITTLLGLAALMASSVAQAAVTDEAFEQVKQMLEQAMERISELEQQQAADAVAPTAGAGNAVAAPDTADQVAANTAKLEKLSWAERLSWQGDFRYRYQPEEANKLVDDMNMSLADISRNRQRIRARAALIAQVADDVEIGLGVATGGDNPVSANQTLGGAGSRKELRLDLAYFDWRFADGANLAAGKVKNPFVDIADTGLLWDGDWRPEGFDLRYRGETFYANGLGTWLAADDGSGSGNSFNYGVQVGATPEVAGAKVDAGIGYWKIKSDGRDCYEREGKEGSNCFGNTSVDTTTMQLAEGGTYIMNYAPVELFAEVSFSDSVGVFADFAKNVDARAIPMGPSAGQKLDTAYIAGGWFGAGKKPGEWQVKAYYQDKEADSVLGLLTDSDFGNGGTDSKGFVVEGKYVLTKYASLKAKYLSAERQDSNGVENGSALTSNPYDVNILQLDVQFKYK